MQDDAVSLFELLIHSLVPCVPPCVVSRLPPGVGRRGVSSNSFDREHRAVDIMEAVGAVSAVLEVGKAAWQLNSALYHLYQDTKSINKTVEDLNREVKALANTCDTIHEELEEAIGKTGTRSNVYDTDNRLWLRIQEQTTECKTTLNELSGIVSDIQEEGGNIVSQGKRQIKMNSRKEDLLSVRSRLHSHTESLHTILLVTNM